MRSLFIKRKLKPEGLLVRSISLLDKGTSKSSYVINAKEGKFVLKTFEKKEKVSVQRQINLMKKINAKEVITIVPINRKVLDFGPKVGYVYSFVVGKTYYKTNKKNKLNFFGKLVGRFSKLTKNAVLPGEDSSHFKHKISEAEKTLRLLKDSKDALHKNARSMLIQGIELLKKNNLDKSFRTQIVHKDLHYDNVFYDGKNYIISDIDGLERDVLVLEVSTLLSYLVSNSQKRFKKDMAKFLSGYESEYKLLKREKVAMPYFMITRKLGEIMYLLEQERKEKLSKEELNYFLRHTLRKLKIILDNFDWLLDTFKKI